MSIFIAWLNDYPCYYAHPQEDAIELTADEEHLVTNIPAGKVVRPNAQGRPTLVDAPAVIAPYRDGPPLKVTAAQGGIALINANLMDAVQAVVDAADTPASVKWAWNRTQDWERASPALAYLAGKAGITDAQMDDLFVAAAKITA